MDVIINDTDEKRFLKASPKYRSKTPSRMSYEAEVDVIRSQIGDLEDIRFRLGLSARKMTQLLLVDPSAWTRWTKKITPPPPHIYRALQWYLTLQEKNPGFTPQVFLASHWHSAKASKEVHVHRLEEQIQALQTKISDFDESPEIAKKGLVSAVKPWIFFGVGLLIGFLLRSWMV